MNILEKKTNLIEQLNNKRNEYTKKNIKYKQAKCKLMLETNFKEVLDSSRPTVDEKKAYIANKTLDLRLEKELLYNDIKFLENKIELCNDEILLRGELDV